jgi:hypothetical protein
MYIVKNFFHRCALFGISLLSACGLVSRASILVVDQDPTNQVADYPQLQPAIDAAQAGDTIYVMGTGEIYESVTVEKSLTLIGAGVAKEVAFPAAPNLESKLGTVTIKAQGVFLTGFVFTGEVFVLAPSQEITFFRNHFDDVTYDAHLGAFAVETPEVATTISNLHVINNLFTSNNSNFIQIDLYHSGLADNGVVTKQVGFVFANNIMTGGGWSFPHGDGEIFNNFFRVRRQLFTEDGRVAEGRFYNNIIVQHSAGYELSPGELSITHNSVRTGFYNDIFSDPSNVKYEDVAHVIVNEGAWGNAYVPTADSPLKEAGMNGEDIGIFGGPHAWNLNHQPPVPIITKLQAPRIVGAGENLSLQIEVQPNN